MSLTLPSKAYRPFQYPWAYDFWERQQQIHWLPSEISLADDIKEFNKLDQVKRSLVVNVFRMFVQADIDVLNCYHRVYARHFKPTEVQMMLTAFSNMETVHVAAYSHLLDSLGLPETEYHAFLEYVEMKAKHDFMESFDPQDGPEGVALSLAGVSAFGEGTQLFASFAILLNFPRQNLLKGMGQIVSWSVRDESLHCEGIARLFHAYVAEKGNFIDRARLSRKIRAMAELVVATEDKFVDLVFAGGDVPGLSAGELKQYIRFMIDLRLRQLGEAPIYEIGRNPLPWVDGMAVGIEHANFFERQGTEYSKGATAGDWSDVFS